MVNIAWDGKLETANVLTDVAPNVEHKNDVVSAPAFFLKIINSGEATENFILLPIFVIHFKVDPCSHKLKILIYSLICREIRMAFTVMNVVFVLLLSLFTLGKVKQVLFEFLKFL